MYRWSLLIGLLILGAEFLILKGDEIEVSSLPEPKDGNGTVMNSSPNLEDMDNSFPKESESYAGENLELNILMDIRDIVDMIENVDGDNDLPRNCDEALNRNGINGVNKIYLPESGMPPFFVHCQFAGSKNWMFIQRRINGAINFYRDWSYYKNGFGHLNGEYWLGLDLIHAITSTEPHEIWFEMQDHKGERRYARYDHFLIGDEKSKYTLQALGKFIGTAGDSLRFQAGNQFSTKDMDNDSNHNASCAEIRKGAWWFGNCKESHFNGLYNNNENVNPWGIHWNSWRGIQYSLKYVHMAIRPINNGQRSMQSNPLATGTQRSLPGNIHRLKFN